MQSGTVGMGPHPQCAMVVVPRSVRSVHGGALAATRAHRLRASAASLQRPCRPAARLTTLPTFTEVLCLFSRFSSSAGSRIRRSVHWHPCSVLCERCAFFCHASVGFGGFCGACSGIRLVCCESFPSKRINVNCCTKLRQHG